MLGAGDLYRTSQPALSAPNTGVRRRSLGEVVS